MDSSQTSTVLQFFVGRGCRVRDFGPCRAFSLQINANIPCSFDLHRVIVIDVRLTFGWLLLFNICFFLLLVQMASFNISKLLIILLDWLLLLSLLLLLMICCCGHEESLDLLNFLFQDLIFPAHLLTLLAALKHF